MLKISLDNRCNGLTSISGKQKLNISITLDTSHVCLSKETSTRVFLFRIYGNEYNGGRLRAKLKCDL